MNLHTTLTAAACALVALGGCSSSKTAPALVENPERPAVLGRADTMPKAVIYRTSGDFRDNVPVTLGPDGTLQSYPAPSDLTPGRSEPLSLADGFLLDRRGVSLNSAFTRYTYAEYAALPQTPAPDQLLKAIIPGARVTEIYTLPMTPGEAAADTAAVNRIIRDEPGRLTPVGRSPLIMKTK